MVKLNHAATAHGVVVSSLRLEVSAFIAPTGKKRAEKSTEG
jgi:hypothetical protein